MKHEQDPREPHGNGEDSRREWILEQVALGQLAPDAPEVTTLAHRDTVFARELEDLVRTRASAERALREGRELFEQAPGAVTEADRRRVHETLHRLAAASAPASRRRWTPVLVGAGLLAAAAVVVAVMRPWGTGTNGGGTPPIDDNQFLGDEEDGVLSVDLVDGKLVFTWTCETKPGDELELHFYALDDVDRLEPPLREFTVTRSPWTPSESSPLSIPGSFVVELVRRDALGTEEIVDDASFER